MNVFLMFRDRDVDLEQPLPVNEEALTQDLALTGIFSAMGNGDAYLTEIARRTILCSLTDPDEIIYRQYVLNDCLANPAIARQLYDLALEAIQGERKIYRALRSSTPDLILHRSLEVMEMFMGMLKRLRQLASENAGSFTSEGFIRLFTMLATELDDSYLQSVEEHLRKLSFRGGVLMSARLGPGNKGTDYVVHLPPDERWWERIVSRGPAGYSFVIASRDEGGIKSLSELQGRGIDLVANALAQSADHILSFYTKLRDELAFYIGCLNLREQLTKQNEPICFPLPAPAGDLTFSVHGLYDLALALQLSQPVIGNDVDGDGKSLVVITGANQGGKSTFLRSVGQTMLLMQSGMFVPATELSADVRVGFFTHFKREEDASMTSGKLDEELARMSEIAGWIGPDSLLLCNESFASTNEREGSEIARQIIQAFLEAGVKIFYVTHLYDLAHGFFRQQASTTLFLRAPRLPGGQRTFRLEEGEPLPTSYGDDSYRRIFGAAPDAIAEPLPVRRRRRKSAAIEQLVT